jgi:carboxypeptidase T
VIRAFPLPLLLPLPLPLPLPGRIEFPDFSRRHSRLLHCGVVNLLHVARSTPTLTTALAAGALTAAFAAAASLVLGPATPERRVAIRVDCTDGVEGAAGDTPNDARNDARNDERPQGACARAESLAVDVWSEERGPGMPLDVVVPASALDGLAAAGVTWTVIDHDIDAAARAEAERLHASAAASTTTSGEWFAEYRDYTAISKHMQELADGAPERASLHGIGSSLDGRPLWALRIGGAHDDDTPMLLNGTQHAREWIAAMATTCVADRLVREYDDNPAIRQLVDTTEVWIVPVVNPDGYQYSWGQDRYWRKNRRESYGVDLNRNFSVAWGGAGSSGLKRSQTYRGGRPFSENESAALRDLAKREGVRLHIDFHAYGQLVLYPWNHSDKPTDDQARYAALGDRLASAIYAAHGTPYRLMRGVELYTSAGTMSDWMYGEAGAVSFTIELRPRGGTGFVLPPNQIRPTCDEALAAVLALRAPL